MAPMADLCEKAGAAVPTRGPKEHMAALKDLRRQMGVTQAELAAVSGISRGVIASLETDRQHATEEIIDRLLDALETLAKERAEQSEQPAGFGLSRFRALYELLNPEAVEQARKTAELARQVEKLQAKLDELYELGIREALLNERIEQRLGKRNG